MPDTNAPRFTNSPWKVHPRPGDSGLPLAIPLMSGVITLPVKEEIKLLKARATTRPTAIMMRSPRKRKFLNPFNIGLLCEVCLDHSDSENASRVCDKKSVSRAHEGNLEVWREAKVEKSKRKSHAGPTQRT